MDPRAFRQPLGDLTTVELRRLSVAPTRGAAESRKHPSRHQCHLPRGSVRHSRLKSRGSGRKCPRRPSSCQQFRPFYFLEEKNRQANSDWFRMIGFRRNFPRHPRRRGENRKNGVEETRQALAMLPHIQNSNRRAISGRPSLLYQTSQVNPAFRLNTSSVLPPEAPALSALRFCCLSLARRFSGKSPHHRQPDL